MRRGDFSAFATQNSISFTDSIEMLLHRLRQLASAAVGTTSPLIALVEEDESGLKADGVARNLRDYGATVEHVELKDISAREDGKIIVHQRVPVDLVLRYFLARDVQKTPAGSEKLRMLVNANRTGKTAFFAPLDSDIVEPKSALALLYEPTVWQVLSNDEQNAIRRRIPMTRMIRAGHFDDAFGIGPGSLTAKDSWVLKPFNGNGCDGIVIGSEMTTDDWDEQILRAQNIPYVAQQRVWSLEEAVINPYTDQQERWRIHYGIFYSEQEGYQGGIAGGVPIDESAIMGPGASTFKRACIFACEG